MLREATSGPDAAVRSQCSFELLQMTGISCSLLTMSMICLQQLVCSCIDDQLMHKIPMPHT